MYSNILALIVFISTILTGLGLVLYHIRAGQAVWGRKKFMSMVGAFLAGTTVMEFSKGKTQGHLLIVPIVYLVRRLIFVMVLAFGKSFACHILYLLVITLL